MHILNAQNFGKGDPVRICEFYRKNFLKILKFRIYVQQFFSKIHQNFQKFSEIFSTLSKSRKNVIFVPILAQNHYIDQIFGIIFP